MTGTAARRVAVAGTDTGVGKTVVTAGLTAWLREAGIDARAIKPAQTGHPSDDDAAFVTSACGEPDAANCLRYLEPPLAPRVAAEREGIDLSYDDLLVDCERELENAEVGVVEGMGGLRVPLAGEAEVIDLLADIASDAILVSRSGLGTLNHAALSVDALEARGLDVRAIVLNEYRGESVAERTNPAELERMTGVGVRTVPPIAFDSPREASASVRDALSVEGGWVTEFVERAT